MNTPLQQNRGPVIRELKSTAAPSALAATAAKFSIISAVIVIALNWACLTLLKASPSVLKLASIAAFSAVCAGVLAAILSLVGMWKCRTHSSIPLAAVGLLLNGGLLATDFVKPPVLGRHTVFSEQLPAKQLDTRPVSTKSGRTIVTKDWTAGYVINLTQTGFYDVVNNSDCPVLVDFWAPWCGPCRQMSPVIEALASDYEGRVKVCKLNVDDAPQISADFRVRGIPTILLFDKGRVKKKWVGVTSKYVISAEIEKLR